MGLLSGCAQPRLSWRKLWLMNLVLLLRQVSCEESSSTSITVTVDIPADPALIPSKSPAAPPSVSLDPSEAVQPSATASLSSEPIPVPSSAANDNGESSTTSLSVTIGIPADSAEILSNIPSPPPSVSSAPSLSAKPSAAPSISSVPTSTPDPKAITVGAFYYPWTRHKFVVQNPPEGYLRYALEPQQMPVLGNYDDTQPQVIQQHLQWSQQANIHVWFTSWFGPDTRTDSTLLGTVLPLLAQQNQTKQTPLKFAILYETKPWLNDLTPEDMDDPERSFGRLQQDFQYLCQNFVSHPHYFRIQDKPVVFIYLSRSIHSKCALSQAIQYMRRGCQPHNLYIIGDHMWRDPSGLEPLDPQGLDVLDAIANYDIYGNLGRPRYAGPDKILQYAQWTQNWKQRAKLFNVSVVPGVTPGYNDRGHRFYRSSKPAMSRRIAQDLPEGTLLDAMLQVATPLVDPDADNLILVNSWNEWHEDTQIEPVKPDSGFTREPVLLTDDLEYRGYGDLYLKILAWHTHTNNNNPPLAEPPQSFFQPQGQLPLLDKRKQYSLRSNNGTSRQQDIEEEEEEEEEEWEPDWC